MITCRKCGKGKEEYDFHKCAANRTGRRYQCIDCDNQARQGRDFPTTDKPKRCHKCGREKAAEMFGRRRYNKDGLNHMCLVCVAKRDRQYRAERKCREA